MYHARRGGPGYEAGTMRMKHDAFLYSRGPARLSPLPPYPARESGPRDY